MKNENNSPEDVEKRLQKFFDKKSEELKAPSELWAKLEPGLDNPKKKTSPNYKPKRLFNWFAGPRLIGVASSIAVILLLIVTGVVWWAGDNGSNTHSTNLSFDQSGDNTGNYKLTYGTEIPMPTVVPTPSPRMSGMTISPSAAAEGTSITAGISGAVGKDSSNSNTLDTVQRQVISTASLSLEVQIVDTTLSQIRVIAESLGGHLEQMSSSGSEDDKYASVTIRVPQDQFFTALDKLQALGKVQSQSVGSQDVTEQYIDLQARLKSAQQEEQSLLTLLGKAETVTDIILLEKELSQVRSNIENIQGQLNYLERRVDLATIDVSLSTPSKVVGQPPSGSMTIAVHNMDTTVSTIKGLVSSVKGDMGQVSISVNNGDKTATLSFTLYRADFTNVIASIERQGKIQQKYIQEGTTPEGTSTTPAEKPDSYVSITLIEEAGTPGFWTSGHIAVISVTGGGILLLLVAFLYVANRKGLLQKRPE